MEAEAASAVLQCFLDLDNFHLLLLSSSSHQVTFDCSTAQDDAIIIYDKYVHSSITWKHLGMVGKGLEMLGNLWKDREVAEQLVSWKMMYFTFRSGTAVASDLLDIAALNTCQTR